LINPDDRAAGRMLGALAFLGHCARIDLNNLCPGWPWFTLSRPGRQERHLIVDGGGANISKSRHDGKPGVRFASAESRLSPHPDERHRGTGGFFPLVVGPFQQAPRVKQFAGHGGSSVHCWWPQCFSLGVVPPSTLAIKELKKATLPLASAARTEPADQR